MVGTGGSGPVVAGVDYSADSEAVVAYAAWEAGRRGLPLRLVHGFHLPAPCVSPMEPFFDDKSLMVAAEQRLAESRSWVRAAYPELRVESIIVAGSGAGALVDESASASLVIVGSRGEGGFAGLLVGSVAAQVSKHALSSVVVVRRPRQEADAVPSTGRVLAAVDGSERSADVLGFAFEEAAARGVPLVAVQVWSVSEMTTRSVGTVWSHNLTTAKRQLRESTGRILTDALADWPEKFPQVQVECRSMHGDEPARILLEIADEVEADLIVVGASTREHAVGGRLNSVSQTLVGHAQASVAVINHDRK